MRTKYKYFMIATALVFTSALSVASKSFPTLTELKKIFVQTSVEFNTSLDKIIEEDWKSWPHSPYRPGADSRPVKAWVSWSDFENWLAEIENANVPYFKDRLNYDFVENKTHAKDAYKSKKIISIDVNRTAEKISDELQKKRLAAGKNMGNKTRCGHDSLSPSQAIGRIKWFYKCYHKYNREKIEQHLGVLKPRNHPLWSNINFDEFEYTLLNIMFEGDGPQGAAEIQTLLPRPGYFALWDSSTKLGYLAPIDASASCEIPVNVDSWGTCRSSCFTPDQQILFSEKGNMFYKDIKSAYNQKIESVIALDANSTIENIQLEERPIAHYTTELSDDVFNTIYSITTSSGGNLKVTGAHPVVVSSGEVVKAEDIKLNHSLVQVNGVFDQVMDIKKSVYQGNVYNIMPKREKLQDRGENLNAQIIVAQGFLVGSDYYQNEGASHMGDIILRQRMIDPLENKENTNE